MSAVRTVRSSRKLSPSRGGSTCFTPVFAHLSSPEEEETFYTPVQSFASNKLERAGMSTPAIHRSAFERPKTLSNTNYELNNVSGTSFEDSSEDESLYATPSGPAEQVFSELTEEDSADESNHVKVTIPVFRKWCRGRIQNAAVHQHKRKEIAQLLITQEIQKKLQEVEVKIKAMETENVHLERSIRKRESSSKLDGEKKGDMMQKWFDVMRRKHQLFRYESELMVRAKELELEDRHARLSNDMKLMMLKPKWEKSHDEMMDEKILEEVIVPIVDQLVFGKTDYQPMSGGTEQRALQHAQCITTRGSL